MFLDRVDFKIHADLPEDVVLVDLPGISVPNPRHQKITFDFVATKASALVFVLLAKRLFDKDETEIMNIIRQGEASIAKKTFWVINHWDSIAKEELIAERTLKAFSESMKGFGIPDGYTMFKTNALHGLLSQLEKDSRSSDAPDLEKHHVSYMKQLTNIYDGSHDKAFQESGLPQLQQKVFQFLNERIRTATIQTTIENVTHNLLVPLESSFRVQKQRDEAFLDREFTETKSKESKGRVEKEVGERLKEISDLLRDERFQLAEKRKRVFCEQATALVDELKGRIENDPMTDAFHRYNEIVANRPLRKYPYFFEIEVGIVESLNNLLKDGFRSKIREEALHTFGVIANKLTNLLDRLCIEACLSDSEILKADTLIAQTFYDNIDGVVMAKALLLDELLVFKPQGFISSFFRNDNALIEALIDAAKLDAIGKDGQVAKTNMDIKTTKIREALSKLYIPKAVTFRDEVIESAWGIMINHILEVEKIAKETVSVKYRSAIERRIETEVNREYGRKREEFESRNKVLRESLDRISKIRGELTKANQSIDGV